ncbi:MAG: DUF2924 domain-containing protein [Phycisphaerales bacterium]
MPAKGPTVEEQLASLESMPVGELRARYEEVFGEAARSNNRRWLQRRVAWRLQVLAAGELAERTIARVRAKAADLARDADLRVRPPTTLNAEDGPERVVVTTMSPAWDGRLPPPGSVLVRTFKGEEHRVTVRVNGFEHRGEIYRSLSAVAFAITGSHWNGFHFFGLGKRKGARR